MQGLVGSFGHCLLLCLVKGLVLLVLLLRQFFVLLLWQLLFHYD